MKITTLRLSAIAMTTALAACGSDDASNNLGDGKQGGQVSSTSLDATGGKAHLNLESGHTVNADENWHFAYQKFVGFSVNGGVSGDGNISACLAHVSADLYDNEGEPVPEAFDKLTLESTLTDFNSVTQHSCTAEELTQDSIKTIIAMDDWLDQSAYPNLAAKNALSNGWIVRSASKNNTDTFEYARIKVNSFAYARGIQADLTFSVESWDDNAQQFTAAVTSPALEFIDKQVYWDMESNTLVDANGDWELSALINGYTFEIRVNGDASGSGMAAIASLNTAESASAVSNPTSVGYGPSDEIVFYSADTAASAMGGPGNYGALHYNVSGQSNDHSMTPNGATYLFKDGDRYFKAQVISNTGEDGTLTSGNLVVRYAEVTE